MGLLEASQAVIDCGQNELVLEDICRDSTAPDAWNLETSYPNYPKFSGLFTKTEKSTAAKTNVKHRIFTGDHAPINQRAYRVSLTERRIIHEEVQKMLDEGIVQPSESPWSSPVVLSLLKSGVEFHWGPEEVEAFNSLKKALTSDPVLGMYDERASTEIHTDASGYGIGAVLVQIQNNVEKVIAYASRTLTKAEKNYSTTERECLAIVWATNKFRPYIFGKHFTVVTDHHSLCWLMNLKDPSGRLARWALRLQEHDFDVKYKTGKKHSDADAFEKSSGRGNGNIRQIFSSHDEKNFDPDGKLWLPVIPKHLRADILRHFHDAPTAGHLVLRKLMTGFARDFTGRECTEMSFAEVDEIAKFLLEEIVLRHGAPRVIITDRGAVFRSRLVSLSSTCVTLIIVSQTAYHPQTNGLTERFNKTLADMLSMYVDVEQKNWDEILPFVTFAYNTAKQETTGFTPFYLLHGREAETTLDTMLPFCPNDFDDNNITKIAARAEESRQLARVHTLRAQDKDRRRYDSKHQMVSYAPGDLVWVYTPVRKVVSPKTLKKVFRPYQVLRRLSAVTYEVQDFDPASRKRKLRESCPCTAYENRTMILPSKSKPRIFLPKNHTKDPSLVPE
ncbi:retrovirus-related Pol polyprotein from transposon 17.6 [Trichonephila clavipes]|nr:retrovirus-related Pol polyprotein from transposon 17.6 [Trichonephila clavipes]